MAVVLNLIRLRQEGKQRPTDPAQQATALPSKKEMSCDQEARSDNKEEEETATISQEKPHNRNEPKKRNFSAHDPQRDGDIRWI